MSLRGGNGEDGGVVSGTDAVAAVVGEDCRADFEGGGGGVGGYALEDGEGHEGAVEEGGAVVGHGAWCEGVCVSCRRQVWRGGLRTLGLGDV